MVLQDKILEILESMTEGEDALLNTVMYGSPFDANVRMDKKPDPAAIVYLLQSWSIDTTKMIKRKQCDTAIYFCKRYNFDAKGEVVKEVMDTVEPIVDAFISELLSDNSIIVSNIKATASYGKFDCHTCGYTLTFTAIEKQGECFSE